MEVYEFREEDEKTECTSTEFTCKYQIDTDKCSARNVVHEPNIQSKEIDNLQCDDVDLIDDQHDHIVSMNAPSTEDCATEPISGFDDVCPVNSTCDEEQPHFFSNTLTPGDTYQIEARALSPRVASASDSQLNCASQCSSINDDSVDEIADVDESMTENSKSSSDISEDALMDGSLPDRFFVNCQMGDRNVAVVRPDFVIYHGRHCADSVLIFSATCIELKVSAAYGNEETFRWGIDDIIDTKSQFSERLEIMIVRLRMISKDANQGDKEHETSGIEELTFAVDDSNWLKKQEEITSLDLKYKDLWSFLFDTDVGEDEVAVIGENGICYPKRNYFPNFDYPEEVVYPKGEPDAVSISKRDFELLEPDIFVNDTIIDFYIKYLKNKMQPKERHRFHFFNSFFFRKLIDLDKDPSSAFKSGVAFQRVHKWTRKVNLFEKDYIFIPVNFSYHWSLIIICHPGEVAKFQEGDVDKSLRVPCILHMDSIKGSHTGLKDVVQSYLWEEWRERQKEASEDISTRFFNLRFVPLELPQQQNSFDCGLFLLHYVERFLDEAPDNFNPFKITQFSNFLNVDWFPPAEASLKRGIIQRLIYDIVGIDISQDGSINKSCASDCPETNNGSITGVPFLLEKNSQEKLSDSHDGLGIEITLLPERNSQSVGDSGFVLRELFGAGTTSSWLLDGKSPTFDQAASSNELRSAVPPIEQEAEAAGELVYATSDRTDIQTLTAIDPEACLLPYPSVDFGSLTCVYQEISVPRAGHEDTVSYTRTPSCASNNFLEVEIERKSLVMHDLGSKEQLDQPNSSSMHNIKCLTVKAASAPHEMLDGADPNYLDQIAYFNSDAVLFTSCSNGPGGSSFQDNILQLNGDTASDYMNVIDGNSVSELDGKQATNRSNDGSVSKTNEPQSAKRSNTASTLKLEQHADERSNHESLLELYVQHPAKGSDDDSASELNVKQSAKRSDDASASVLNEQQTGDSMSGLNVQLPPKENNRASVLELNEQQAKKRNNGGSALGIKVQQPAKRSNDNLMSELNDQVDKSSSDDSVLKLNIQQPIQRSNDAQMSELDEEQAHERSSDGSGFELDARQPAKMGNDASALELDEHQADERSNYSSELELNLQQPPIRSDDAPASELNEQQADERGDGSVLELSLQQPAKRSNDASVSELSGQETNERSNDDSAWELSVQLPAKRSDDARQQPAKRLRLTSSLDGNTGFAS